MTLGSEEKESDDEHREITFAYRTVPCRESTLCGKLMGDTPDTRSDLIFLTETRTDSTEYFELPGYAEICRINGEGCGRQGGVMVYARESLRDRFTRLTTCTLGGIHSISLILRDSCRFLVVCALPVSSLEDKFHTIRRIIQAGDEYQTVLLGNFDVDFASPNGKSFLRMMEYWTTLSTKTVAKHPTVCADCGRTATPFVLFSNDDDMETGCCDTDNFILIGKMKNIKWERTDTERTIGRGGGKDIDSG